MNIYNIQCAFLVANFSVNFSFSSPTGKSSDSPNWDNSYRRLLYIHKVLEKPNEQNKQKINFPCLFSCSDIVLLSLQTPSLCLLANLLCFTSQLSDTYALKNVLCTYFGASLVLFLFNNIVTNTIYKKGIHNLNEKKKKKYFGENLLYVP